MMLSSPRVCVTLALFLVLVLGAAHAQTTASSSPNDPKIAFVFREVAKHTQEGFALMLSRNVTGVNGEQAGSYESLVWHTTPMEDNSDTVVTAQYGKFSLRR
jgi:hypothetical protein